MTDDKLENLIRQTAADYNAPAGVPKEEMWQRIESVRRGRRRLPAKRTNRWLIRAVGIAAVLTLGVAIGRMSIDKLETVADNPAAAATGGTSSEALHLAVRRHLDRTETFLTLVKTEASGGYTDEGISGKARQLLSTTRMLLDTPAFGDAEVNELLSDIELVLAQIARLSDERRNEELNYINEGIEERNMLPRLRGLEPGPGAAHALGGAL